MRIKKKFDEDNHRGRESEKDPFLCNSATNRINIERN
jgi:hypothetical protein